MYMRLRHETRASIQWMLEGDHDCEAQEAQSKDNIMLKASHGGSTFVLTDARWTVGWGQECWPEPREYWQFPYSGQNRTR